MALKQFKTESKRLLDLMANSIYTNKDIFLRELISNASDALDKRHYMTLTDTSIGEDDPHITIDIDKANRTLTISDNGVGMNKEDLENNLGTIAKSGSFDFVNDIEDAKEVDIIGRFGVGFYSAFMVADKVEVSSKKVADDKAYLWTSDGEEGYEIKTDKREDCGTSITLHIKKNDKHNKYDQYLDSPNIQALIKRYSDYIRYPIRMDVEVTRPTETEGKTEKVIETKTINSQTPLWKRAKKDIKQDEYDDFYMQEYYDYSKPLKTIHYKVEGNTSYSALLYIPGHAPYNFYNSDYKLGLKLYSKGVFIKDEAKELVSDYFRFIRGLIDSDDLSLNISRELLQQDHQMETIRKSVDKRIKNTLEKMMKDEFEEYCKFFDDFGAQLKYGVYENFGRNKDILIDLIIFKSSHNDDYTSLKDYIDRMKENQTEIYYVVGPSIDKIKEMPQMEKVLDAGYEVLYFTDNVDEFMVNVINNYEDHPFHSINKGDLDLASEEEKKRIEEENDANKDILEDIKKALNDEVKEVRLSNRLKSHPVCLVSADDMSIDMEKFLEETGQDRGFKANKILEINPDHEIFSALKGAYEKKEDISDYAKVLYDQARLIAGLSISDPLAYSDRVSGIMLKAMK